MKDITKLFLKYNPIFAEEEIYKTQMLDFIENYDNIFSRNQTYGHFTASSFLLNSDCSKFLLMHHKKLKIWVQPGGHCDGEENLLNVSLKEAKEESGIESIIPISEDIFDIDVHLVPPYGLDEEHFHFDVRFLLKAAENDEIIKNDESLDLKWFAFHSNELKKLNLQRPVTRMIEKYGRQKNKARPCL